MKEKCKKQKKNKGIQTKQTNSLFTNIPLRETIDIARSFGMQHLLCACIFVSLRFYIILLPKAEGKAIYFSEQLSVQFNNKHRKPSKKTEKPMMNHAHTYQGKRYF